MIQLALRSSTQAEPDAGSARSEMIEGSATAVTISSRPARKTPAPRTASRTSAERRSISAVRSITGKCSSAGRGVRPACGARLGRGGPSARQAASTSTSTTHLTQSSPRWSGRTRRHGAPFVTGSGPPATPSARSAGRARGIERRRPAGRGADDHSTIGGGGLAPAESRTVVNGTPSPRRLERPARRAIENGRPIDRAERRQLGE